MNALLATRRGRLVAVLSTGFIAGVVLTSATLMALKPVPGTLLDIPLATKPQVLDRRGHPLTVTYQNRWNLHDRRTLHDIPVFLQQAFVLAEDKRFYAHRGMDWRARMHALWQNLIARRVVRGASTITEQTVRMLEPRPRTVWSRWLEGWQARRLERASSKVDILEFYLNQVPYGGNRRGVVQAARHYFDRDLDTLNQHEMLALAVLVRAPSRLAPNNDNTALKKSVLTLAQRARQTGLLSTRQFERVAAGKLELASPELPVHADHFVAHVYRQSAADGSAHLSQIHTTLDAELQKKAQTILDERLAALAVRRVHNAALLLVDHRSDEILAWVSAHNESGTAASWYDPVTVPRQPGSTLKPFVYAMALEKGWTAATLIDDSPLEEAVHWGLHDYHNYSRRHYGPVRLRDALGNSLNIPALKAIQYVGNKQFLDRLHRLGVHNLRRHPEHYGDGLALGNGEITLLELVGAYATLARQGVYRPLRSIRDVGPRNMARIAFSPEVSSLIADILSDADARSLEFGYASLLRFPVQTAIKTGTSSDYRDAWAVAFNHRFTAGVWMGNLSDQPMNRVTGARGPVLVLRSLFAELNRRDDTAPLRRSSHLVKARICRDTGLAANGNCASRDEWFRHGKMPKHVRPPAPQSPRPSLRRPSDGLMLAMDPRIPDDSEAFEFMLEDLKEAHRIDWYVDGQLVQTGGNDTYLWPLKRGEHVAWARVWERPEGRGELVPAVNFIVK